MKSFFVVILLACSFFSFHISAQTGKDDTPAHKARVKNLYIDVHQLEPGKVTYKR
jgi:hypothetical protein